jgi:hypothetical protein
MAKLRIFEDTATRVTYQESLNGYNTESTKSLYNTTATSLVLAVSDWKVWYLGLAELLSIIAFSHYLYFPTLTKTMGYNPTISLLLCAPPWLLTTVWCLWLSWHSDKKGERCMHVVTPYLIAIMGAVLAMSTMNTAARYLSLYVPQAFYLLGPVIDNKYLGFWLHRRMPELFASLLGLHR